MALNINGTTGISGVDGSVSAPAVTGTDSNTGITFPSADTIKFATGGVERMSITNSGVSGITAGITMCDTWVVTTDFTTTTTFSDDAVTSNWYNLSTQHSSFGGIGSSMTESSGIFTFPSNGIYLVSSNFVGKSQENTGPASYYAGATQYLSTDSGSNFSITQFSYSSAYGAGSHFQVRGYVVYDITDFSTTRLKFHVATANSIRFLGSGTAASECGATFMKLGET